MNIIDISAKRFTAKKYDGQKKIPADSIQQLCTLLRNTPSSLNSQPWHFLVIQSEQYKQKILPAIKDFNIDRVKDASHIIVFCAKTEISPQHVQSIVGQEEKDGRFANADIKHNYELGLQKSVDAYTKTIESSHRWEREQVFIALGQLLLGAASLGIDATAIGGYYSDKLDEILDLKSKGLFSVVLTSLGYHTTDDLNSQLPKSRLPAKELFTFL